MEDQKAENLLNLALSVPEEMRERTEELNVGFNRKERTWEIIVKYHGDLGSALNAKFPDASGTYLFNDFAILRVPELSLIHIYFMALRGMNFGAFPVL